MKDMYTLKETLCRELSEMSDKEKLSMADIEIIDKLSHSVKSINKIIEDDEEGMSRESYRRGRDRMGRYVSRDDGPSHRHESDASTRYYYDGEPSHGKDSLISKLNKMMDEAESKSDRVAIRQCLSQIQNG